MKPLFKHDCDKCVFLGVYKNHDLYYCNTEPTVIARYGDNGCEYFSGIHFTSNDYLNKAKLIAIEKGLF
jgi:hypothetical protein